MDKLNVELLSHILSYLPVRHSKRMKKVSDSFNNAISNHVGTEVAVSANSEEEFLVVREVSGNDSLYNGPPDVNAFSINTENFGILNTTAARNVYIGRISPKYCEAIPFGRPTSVRHVHFLGPVSYIAMVKTVNMLSKTKELVFSWTSLNIEYEYIIRQGIDLPRLTSLKFVLNDEDYPTVHRNYGWRTDNFVAIMHGKFPSIKHLYVEGMCHNGSLDAIIRNAVFSFIVKNQKTLETIDCCFEYSSPNNSEAAVDESAIAMKIIEWPKDFSVTLRRLSIFFRDVPAKTRRNLFGVYMHPWLQLAPVVKQVETLRLSCDDECWSTRSYHKRPGYVTSKPSLFHIATQMCDGRSLKILELGVTTWAWELNAQSPTIKRKILPLDFSVFKDCEVLERLALVGQWLGVPSAPGEVSGVCNVSHLPQNLRQIRLARIYLSMNDICSLLERVCENGEEIFLKNFYKNGYVMRIQRILDLPTYGLELTCGNVNLNSDPALLAFSSSAIAEKTTELKLSVTKSEAESCQQRVEDFGMKLDVVKTIANCKNLRRFDMFGKDIYDDGYKGKHWDAQFGEPVISNIQCLPKCLVRISLENVYMKNWQLRFITEKLPLLHTLYLRGIGEFRDFGMQPLCFLKILKKRSLKSLKITQGLNLLTWEETENENIVHSVFSMYLKSKHEIIVTLASCKTEYEFS